MLTTKIRYLKKFITYGFTLIEILIAVIIVAILALIAIPSFSEQLNRTRVDTAAQAMLRNAQFLHKWQFLTGGYRITNKTSIDKCPYLPYQYESNSAKQHFYYLASSDAHLKGKKISNGQYVDTELTSSTCRPTEFTLRAYPICGTSVEKYGVICLDEDGNILKRATPACNSAGEIKEFYCVDDSTKDKERENTIDDNNPPAPPHPRPDKDPDDYNDLSCLNNKTDLACICATDPSLNSECKTIPFCLEHPSQKQCLCVLHPEESGCHTYCEIHHEDKAYPAYCEYPENEMDIAYCEQKGKDKDTCIAFPERHECYQACKYEIPHAKWCDEACKNFPEGQKPGWCPANPSDKKYEEGSEEVDTCGNVYTCKDPVNCNNKTDPTLTPDGSRKFEAWQLKSCKNGLSSNFFESTATKNYKNGAIFNTESCVSYRCNNIDGCSAKKPAYNAPSDLNTADWIPCYNLCPATLESFYQNQDYSFGSRCVTLYICINSKLCNDINGEHQPGNEKAHDDDTTWRTHTQ